METIDYKGWTIRILAANRGFGVIMTAPWGETFQQPTICWQGHLSARRYAKTFIDWYLKLEDQYQEQNISLHDRGISDETTEQC